jgi:hypothetical protein
MILDRLQILRGMFAWADRTSAERVRRWSKAHLADPNLMKDLVALGGLLQIPHEIPPNPMNPTPVDPDRLAFEAGQRDMAVKLSALMGVTNYELTHLMEDNDADQ